MGSVFRFFAICAVTFAGLVAYGALRLRSLFVRGRERRASYVARARGRVLRWGMSTLGATFIKLGQVMSSRPDLFPPEMIAELRKLQDRLPAFAFAKVRRTVEGDLGKPLEELYEDFDREPVAAASVAQVHRATLAGGDEVAVKVLRPDVRRKAQRDGRILIGMAKLMRISPKARASDPVGHMRHFVDGIVEQTDLRNEAAHYAKLDGNFRDVDGVEFPSLYPELSGEHVLTMKFIRGAKLDELGDGNHDDIARRARLAYFKMCYEDGYVHADLHPGNMLVTEDRELVIFDCGLCKELDDELLVQLVDFSKCVAMGTTEDFVNHLKQFHHYLEGTDWDEVEKDADEFVKRFRSMSVADLEMGEFINEVFAVARKHNIRPIPEMTLILVGTVTAEGISKMLEPQANSFHEMASFLLPIIARRGLDKGPLERFIEKADALLAAQPRYAEGDAPPETAQGA